MRVLDRDTPRSRGLSSLGMAERARRQLQGLALPVRGHAPDPDRAEDTAMPDRDVGRPVPGRPAAPAPLDRADLDRGIGEARLRLHPPQRRSPAIEGGPVRAATLDHEALRDEIAWFQGESTGDDHEIIRVRRGRHDGRDLVWPAGSRHGARRSGDRQRGGSQQPCRHHQGIGLGDGVRHRIELSGRLAGSRGAPPDRRQGVGCVRPTTAKPTKRARPLSSRARKLAARMGAWAVGAVTPRHGNGSRDGRTLAQVGDRSRHGDAGTPSRRDASRSRPSTRP